MSPSESGLLCSYYDMDMPFRSQKQLLQSSVGCLQASASSIIYLTTSYEVKTAMLLLVYRL